MMTIILYAFAVLLGIANFHVTLCRYLMMFQQNSYRPSRFRRWASESGDSTTFPRLIGLLIVFSWGLLPAFTAVIITSVFSLINYITLVRKKYKKPLAFTHRVWRIFVTSFILAAIICAFGCLITGSDLAQNLRLCTFLLLCCYCIASEIMIAANWLLKPIENSITRKYLNEAHLKLAALPQLKIIGITGSYGKTTTKHYLQRILSERYETLMTPGSYNTPMGVVRTIREMLKPYHEVFIVEMGAKQKGDIAEICDIVKPQSGVITAVGPQHLESFGNIETVQSTKFELADAIPSDGLVLVNNDFEKIADRKVVNTRCLRYAVKNTACADYVAEDINYSPSGTIFTLRRISDGHTLKLETRLLGECNVSNLLAGAAIAMEMGVADNSIRYAVGQIEPVEHRLSIKRIPGGLTILDDAFNSNPVGSAMALDVLASMKSGKRILITPGMIELGEQQFELNKAFGKKAATSCDIVIVVGQYNREAITDGLTEGGMAADKVYTPATFSEAQQILGKIATAGDIVLYENDLPDTFK